MTPRRSWGVVPADLRTPYDIREVIAAIVDGSRLDEFKARFGRDAGDGLRQVMGLPVGSSPTTASCSREAAQKGAHFVELCSQRSIRSCSSRTSPASWSAGNTRTKGSRGKGPRW
jgi:3-methylcrotonyl-CoA carboxylase beta subunit